MPLALLVACLATLPSQLLAAPASHPATRPASSDKAALVTTLENYYAKLYGKTLAEKNRLSRLIGVASLARVGGAPITKELLSVSAEQDPLVGQLIWEAIHARQSTLTPAERDRWRSAGFELARKGAFPGATIAPLLAVLGEKPAATYKGLPELFVRVAAENDPAAAEGKPALDAARDAIAAWRDPRVPQFLVVRVQKTPALMPRVAEMLGGLPDPPAPEADAVKFVAVWNRYLRVTKLKPPTTLPAYAAGGGDGASANALFAPPEMIVDPNDKKWRKDLELPRLEIDAVELAICVDATASMLATNEYVTAYVGTASRLMRLMSDQVRCGAVYYRHEIDKDIMLPCCVEAPQQKDNFRTRTIAFATDPSALVKQMLAQKLTGRTGHGKDRKYAGAYAGGIETALNLKWAPKARRIVVCTGDDNATPGSEKKLIELSERAKKDGTLLLFVVRDATAAKSIRDASLAATGREPIVYKADLDKLKATTRPADVSSSAVELFQGSAFETMTISVLELSLPEGYRDRVKPLIAAVLPILKAQDAAAKASVGMGTGTGTGTGK